MFPAIYSRWQADEGTNQILTVVAYDTVFGNVTLVTQSGETFTALIGNFERGYFTEVLD